MDSKQCSQCGEVKSADLFRHGRRKCKVCEYQKSKEWKDRNKDKIKAYSQNYIERNRNKINEKIKSKYHENREEYLQRVHNYRQSNPEKIKESSQRYYQENHKERLEYHKKYRKENSEKIAKNKLVYERNRLSKDPSFKLRRIVRNSVYCAILRNGSRKSGSILDNLPYSMEELKNHIEGLFESWMSWDNWGVYDPDIWDDNDPSTWTWHIDHVIRQADLPYDSLDHLNFQRCWALSNLRPYSSKMNVIENSRRIT